MTHATPIRVLIVEDSPVTQLLLSDIINADPRLQVVGSVSSGEAALEQIPRLRPDVISMDVSLPGADGLEITRQIMQVHPTPIVVVSSHINQRERDISFNALKAGALSVLDKPPGLLHPDHEKQARQLCTQLVIMSQVKVIRQRSRPKPPPVVAMPRPPQRSSSPYAFDVLGIVASTGGPRALSTLLNALGPDFPLPILLVQHITASFLGGFIDWLTQATPFQAVQAYNGKEPQPGQIYLAPAERHLLYARGCLATSASPPVSYQRPSGTVLLSSLARELGPRAIGVVLTGMGDDGAEGLRQMRLAGAYTLAEAESSAVVYGMPAVAARLDAACDIVPIDEMGMQICERLYT